MREGNLLVVPQDALIGLDPRLERADVAAGGQQRQSHAGSHEAKELGSRPGHGDRREEDDHEHLRRLEHAPEAERRADAERLDELGLIGHER